MPDFIAAEITCEAAMGCGRHIAKREQMFYSGL